MTAYQVRFENPDGSGDVTVWEGEADDWKHAVDLAEAELGPLTRIDVHTLAEVKYPEVEVEAAHLKQNAVAAVSTALRVAGVPLTEVAEFASEALHAEHPMQVIGKWVTVV